MNTLKKLIIGGVTLALLVGGITTYRAWAATYSITSILGSSSTLPGIGNAYVGYVLTGNSTYTNGQTNVTYYTVANNTPSLGYALSQPFYAYSSNYLNGFSNQTIGGVLGYTNVTQFSTNLQLLNPYAFTQFGTNSTFAIYTNGFTVSSGSNQLPTLFNKVIELQADANGQYLPNYGFTFVANSDHFQEIGALKFNIAFSMDKLTWNTNNLWTLNMTLNGTNPVVTNFVPPISPTYTTQVAGSTNTPNTNTFISPASQGFRFAEIYNIITPTNSAASTNVYLYVGEFSTFTP